MNTTELTAAQKDVVASIDSFSTGFIIITAVASVAACVVLVLGWHALRAAKPPVLLQPGPKNNWLEVAAAAQEEVEYKGCSGCAARFFLGKDKYDMDHP